MDAGGVGSVINDAASATRSDGFNLTSALLTFLRNVVNSAVSCLISSSEKSNIPSFSIRSAPGVADNPVACAVL